MPDATSISDRNLFPLLAGKMSPGVCRLLRQNLPRGDVKRTAKLAISLFSFLAAVTYRSILQALGRSPKQQLVILYYHGIPCAYRSNFVRQMELLRAARVWPASYRGRLP